MNLFGREKKDNSEGVEEAFEAIEDLESHLNAIDNAVQHQDQELDEIVKSLRREEEFLENIEANRDRLERIRKIFTKFASVQSNYIENVDVLDSEVRNNKKTISRLESRISKLENDQDSLLGEVEDLRSRLDQVESDFLIRDNSQEFDIEAKVDETDFEDFKDKFERQISMLRTSVNDLADKIEDGKIKTESE